MGIGLFLFRLGVIRLADGDGQRFQPGNSGLDHIALHHGAHAGGGAGEDFDRKWTICGIFQSMSPTSALIHVNRHALYRHHGIIGAGFGLQPHYDTLLTRQGFLYAF
ncbi:hypothetical protein ACSDBR_06970 [Acidithiobacillus ferriphilus]|uniref:hypothetical protein n=1 Tax=Acidithiobacillus ferriphilus TaxID=1689834 RepID=UPI003F512DE4